MTKLRLLLLLLTLNIVVHGQEFPMLHFDESSGLPSDNVYQAFRDIRGYMWFATDKGIVRYNGIKFETFTMFDGLSDNEVFFFQEDAYGRMWMGTFNGELCYYKNDSFHTAQNTPFLKLPAKLPQIYHIVPGKDSSVTINFGYRKNIIANIKGNSCRLYNIDKIAQRANRDGGSTNAYWYSANIYTRQLENGSYEATYLSYPVMSEQIIFDTLQNIEKVTRIGLDVLAKIVLGQNKAYFVDKNYVYTDDNKKLLALRSDSYDPYSFHAYFADSSGHFLGGEKGLVFNDSISILKDAKVSSVTKDNSGNYWISTLNKGVYCLRKEFRKTTMLKSAYNGKAVFAYGDPHHVYYVTSDNDLFGLDNNKVNSIYKYHKKKKTFSDFRNDATYTIDEAYNYYGIYDTDITVIKDLRKTPVRPKRYDNFGEWSSIKATIPSGRYLYTEGRDIIFQIPLDKMRDSSYSRCVNGTTAKERLFGMAKDESGQIWYSTRNNIYKIQDGGVKVQPQFNGNCFKSFGFYGKYMVGYDHANQLLICSDIGGAIRIDTVPQQNCIWNKFYKLDASHILISTDNLYRVLTLRPGNSKRRYEIATIEDPFVPLHAENICADTSTCYFFSDHNITALDIQSLLKKAKAPTLYFSSLRVGKRTYPIGKVFTIAYDQARSVSINFATLSPAGKTFFYQYSISKNDEDHWHDLGGERIDLFDPGYGSYMIKVRARSIASDYCVPISFVLGIGKPYWATWWFIVLIIVALAGIIVFVARQRIAYALRRSRQAHDTEVKFMRSEYKALNALMNPHFIFNTLNNVQSLVNENDKVAANKYLRIFADLVRQNMHNVSEELITLQKEMELVSNYLLLEKLRFEDRLTYKINVNEEVDMSDIRIPPLLIQPIVENSIKHGILPLQGKDGLVEINIFELGDMLHVEVKDNGVGLNAAQLNRSSSHESYGMSNIRKRIDQLRIIHGQEITFSLADIVNEDGKVMGTIATITMLLGEQIPVTEI